MEKPPWPFALIRRFNVVCENSLEKTLPANINEEKNSFCEELATYVFA